MALSVLGIASTRISASSLPRGLRIFVAEIQRRENTKNSAAPLISFGALMKSSIGRRGRAVIADTRMLLQIFLSKPIFSFLTAAMWRRKKHAAVRTALDKAAPRDPNEAVRKGRKTIYRPVEIAPERNMGFVSPRAWSIVL